MNSEKKIITGITLILAAALLVLTTLPQVQANILYCLSDGEKLPPSCSGSSCKYICSLSSGSGFCQVCTTNSGFPGVNPSSCFGQVCNFLGGEEETDLNPPNLTILSPLNSITYNDRRIIFDITSDAPSKIEHKSLNDNNWKTLCDSCTSYSRQVRLEEGANEITIRAKKKSNNLVTEITRIFSIDSRAPDFISSLPNNNEYANGEFSVEYTEENLNKVELNYKKTGETSWNILELTGCSSGQGVMCSTSLDLSQYENSELEYFFNICDSASCDAGDTKKVRVDSSPLSIESFTKKIEGRYATFHFEITEPFFKSVEYIDYSDSRPRWKTLCNHLENNICEKRVSFKDGEHELDFKINDEAGNSIELSTTFFIDSKAPRITRTEPTKGFIASPFYLEFTEENPLSLILNYGNSENSFLSSQVDINNNCVLDRSKYKCTTDDISLSQFDSQEISYWFELTDIANQSTTSRERTLEVDTTFPIINSLSHDVKKRSVTLVLDITELNFDEATYLDNSDSRPRERVLCSRLKDNLCVKRITLREGVHNLNIQVFDEAGNSVGQSLQVVV